MGETLEKNQDKIVTRARRGAMSEGGTRQKKETPIVTNVLNLVGKGAKSGTTAPVGPGGKASLKKSTAENQRKYWSQRIGELTVAVNADLAVLEMMPGTQAAVQEWKAKLERAKLPQKEGRWQDSHKEIASVQTELRKSVAAQSQQKLVDLKSSTKQRKEYEKLNSELAEMKVQLEDYPDGANLTKTFASDAQTAASEYKADRYLPALESMKKAHQTAKSTLQDLDSRDKNARGLTSPFGDLSTKLDKLNKLIDEKAETVGDALVEPFRVKAQTIYKEVLEALRGGVGNPLTDKRKQQGVKSKELTGRADAVELELLKVVNLADQQRRSAETSASMLQTQVADGAEIQAASVVQGAYQSLQQMRNAIGTREYAKALELGATLEKDIKAWPTLPPTGDARFAAVQKAAKAQFLDPARKQLEVAKALLAKQSPVLDTPPTAASTVELLDAQIEKFEGNPAAYPVGEGIDSVARAAKANELNTQREKDYLALTRTRNTLKGQLDGLVTAIGLRLDGLKKTLSAGGGDIARLPAYEDACDAAMAQWDTAAEGATAVSQLPFAAVKAQLEAIQTKIDEDVKDPAVLKDRGIEGRFATLTKAFEKTNADAGQAVEALMEVTYEEGDNQRGKMIAARDRFFAAIKKRDADAAQKAIDEVAAVTVSAGNAVKTANDALKKAKDAWYEQSGAVNDALRALVDRAKSKKFAAYAGVVKTLLGEKQAMFLVVQESADASVLTAIMRDLQALKTEIATLKSVFDKADAKTKPGPTDITIESLTKRAETLAKGFGDKLVKTMEPDALKAISAKRQAIADAIGTAKLGDSDRQLSELAEEWAALLKKAQDHETAITAFLADIEKVTADVTSSGIATGFPDYAASIDKRLKALASDANDGKEDKKALAELKKEIAETSLHTAMLTTANDKAQIAELADVVAAKKWAADYAAFQGRLQALKLVKKGIADPEKQKTFAMQVDQTTDAAKALAKSEGKVPYATMAEQLQALVTNVNNMVAYPMGVETHAQGQVIPTIKDFNAAVEDFHKKVDTMLKTVVSEINAAELTADVKQTAIQTVTQRVTKERALIAINTITPMATKMLKAGDDLEAARDAREEAMREVKRLQRMVEGAPFKALASNNPFDKTLLDSLRNMSARLFDVETNLTISL